MTPLPSGGPNQPAEPTKPAVSVGAGHGTAVTITGATLTTANTLKLRVLDATSNTGAATTQYYVLDNAAPAIGITRVANAADGTHGNGQTSFFNAPVFPSDGTVLAFYSAASILVPGGTNGRTEIFAKKLDIGAITNISLGGREILSGQPSRQTVSR